MRYFFLKIVIVLTGLVSSQKIQAQNFEWLKTLKNSSGTNFTISSIISLPNGKSAILFPYYSMGGYNDSIIIDSYKIISPNSPLIDYYMALIDSNGKAIKLNRVATFSPIGSSASTYPVINSMCLDDSGNFFTLAYLDTKDVIGNDTLLASKGRIVFSKFDKNFNYLWSTQTGNSKPILLFYYNVGNINLDPSPRSGLLYNSGHLYFQCVSTDSTKIGKKIYNFGTGITSIYGELKPSNGEVLWSNYLHSPPADSKFRLSGMLPFKNKFYFSGDFGSEPLGSFSVTKRTVVLNKDTLYGPGGFIVETDSLGNYLRRFEMHNSNMFTINCISTDGVFLNFGGTFRDSIKWGSKTIVPGFPPKSYKKRVDYASQIYSASISTSFEKRWFFTPKILDPSNDAQTPGGVNFIKYKDGFLYTGGQFFNKIEINNTVLIPRAVLISFGEFLIFKADTIGNILWATKGDGAISSMDTRFGSSVYAAGVFRTKIELGPFKDSTGKTTQFGRFLTKITDYSITRGKVSNGPYCAGDTIKVPYKLVGKFDTNNVFIAELSNEQGNFDGGGRELGRLKSNKDGVVKGTLPVFQVSTSTQYRIRIRSTSPKIQSYYVTDTLRLLIYSKDKANPGPPETICMGDSLKLNTYGGTKWAWSPKYRMDDSTKRQPIVWPIKNTTYKIIIGDSSGCGAPDTAFKKVIVRPALKTVLAFKDTTVCGDGALRVPYYFTGGDSVNYRFQWYFVSNPKLWFTMKSGQNVLRDTLTYTPSDPIEKLAIILKDGCTNKADTAFLIISQRKPVTIKSSYRDTTLCTGNLLKYKATATGGVPKQYRYHWKDLVSNSILSTTDSLKILTKKVLKIQLIVNDGCEALGDTAVFEVKVKAELKALTNLRDTTICAAKPLNYTATATGGNGKAYKFYWLLDGKQIDTINHLPLTINNSSTLILITKDNCSLNDTVKKLITVNPSPKADFSWDLACSRTVTKFQFTGTKPNSPITTIFHWNFNNESPSYLENPAYLFTLAGTKKISLATTSSNGCTDTIKKDVVIKPQSKADFTATDVCETDSVVFINKSQDATSYKWKFGDGQTTNLPTPKHNYKISNTTTYNVTLVAQVTNGCADSVTKAVTINKNPSSDFSYTYNGTKVDLKITKAGNSYQWKFGTTDSAKTSATSYTHTIKSSDQTKVCLTATDISGCSSQTCKNVSVGILKVLKSDGFKLYPNPNSGSFTIEIDNPSKDVSIEIFNLLGERVERVEKVGKVNSLDLNVADGMYWVRVKNGEVVWNQKVSISFGVETNR